MFVIPLFRWGSISIGENEYNEILFVKIINNYIYFV